MAKLRPGKEADGLKVIKLMVAAKTLARAPAPVDSPRLVSSTEKARLSAQVRL